MQDGEVKNESNVDSVQNEEEEGVAKELINIHEGKHFAATLGDISEEPEELTKSEYDAKNPSKRPSKPNPFVSGEPWTPCG